MWRKPYIFALSISLICIMTLGCLTCYMSGGCSDAEEETPEDAAKADAAAAATRARARTTAAAAAAAKYQQRPAPPSRVSGADAPLPGAPAPSID
jgi:hypothetical protein